MYLRVMWQAMHYIVLSPQRTLNLWILHQNRALVDTIVLRQISPQDPHLVARNVISFRFLSYDHTPHGTNL
jgi:hypothetical protein